MGFYQKTPCGPIHWEDFGGQGSPIVLVHGLGGSTATWEAVAPLLRPSGRVMALDLPGFGLTPPRRDWELETHAEAVTEVLEETSPASLIGNSMGGLVSQMVAAARPDLVENLVLICPATPPRWRDPLLHWPTARRLTLQSTRWLGPALARIYLSRSTTENLVRNAIRMTTFRPSRVPPTLVDSFFAMANARKHLPWTPRAVPMTSQSVRRIYWRPSRFVAMIREIVAPTLVIAGEADHIVSPTAVRWMTSLRPDWDLVTLADTGHTPHLDAPARLSRVITRWLGGSARISA